MHLDRITEAIAHFIGVFEITVDQVRFRESYNEFDAKKNVDPELPELVADAVPFAAPYELIDYEPDVPYEPKAPDLVPVDPEPYLNFVRPDIPVGGPNGITKPGDLTANAVVHASSPKLVLPEVETVGSVANYMSQGIRLSDNDYFGVGGHGLYFAPDPISDVKLMELTGEAAAVSPLTDLEMPGSAEEITEFVNDAFELADMYPEDEQSEEIQTVIKATTIDNVTVVNGEITAEKPKLEDYRNFNEEGEDEGPSGSSAGADINDPSVTVETGNNLLVNDAVLKSFWTGAPVTAVEGKYIELNIIVQVNAWSDSDYAASAVGDWIRDPTPTEAFNIATFERFDSFEEPEPNADMGFPQHWVIKEIEGDLMIVNWLQQFTFMMDNDVGILSSSGVTTCVSSGDNQAFNSVSIDEIGFAYDLIIAGGSIFDANIIQQMNILCDDDLIGSVDGFQSSGEGSVSTSGNLLWNQAYIYNVGAADRFEPLPAGYQKTAEQLANGGNSLDDSVLSDPAFAGYGPLRVLYIKGDLLNLQYIKQTNILGDSDQLALAMHARDLHPEADWTVTTGSNTLVNNAAILDLDALGKTYVGQEHYSTELLIQAEIISTDPNFGGQDPNVLVNEAVAFLDDDMTDAEGPQIGQMDQGNADYLHSDGVHSLIG